MRTHEALKAQGMRPYNWKWPKADGELFCMAGNATNLNVVARIFEVLLPQLGFVVPNKGDYVLKAETGPTRINQSFPSTAKGYNEYQRRCDEGKFLKPISLRTMGATLDTTMVAKLQAKLAAQRTLSEPADSERKKPRKCPLTSRRWAP